MFFCSWYGYGRKLNYTLTCISSIVKQTHSPYVLLKSNRVTVPALEIEMWNEALFFEK